MAGLGPAPAWWRLVVSLPVVAGACGGVIDPGPPVAIPSVSVDRARVPSGGFLRMTYRFIVTDEVARRPGPYRVAVQFLDAAGEVMFTDDHDPPVAATEWRAGGTVQYERPLFVPLYPYVGPASIAVGLYAPATGARPALVGAATEGGVYVVGRVELAPPQRRMVTFGEGWHRPELDGSLQWRWSTGEATIIIHNPRRDSTLYLELDGRPDLFDPPQRVDLTIANRTVETFVIAQGRPQVFTARFAAADLGDDDTIPVTLRVDRTFAPGRRRLGVRLFHLLLEPR